MDAQRRKLFSVHPWGVYEGEKEWSPWEENDFGPLFLNVLLCLIPAGFLLIAKICFIILEIRKSRKQLEKEVNNAGREIEENVKSPITTSLSFKQIDTHEKITAVRDRDRGSLNNKDVTTTSGDYHLDRDMDEQRSEEAERRILEGVTVVYRQQWASWRQSANAAFTTVVFCTFLMMMLACQMERLGKSEMPITESIGSGCLSLGGILAISIYRVVALQPYSKVGKPSKEMVARTVCVRAFWFMSVIVACLRLQSACRVWDGFSVGWKVCWLLLSILETTMAFIAMATYLKRDARTEEAEEYLRKTYLNESEGLTDMTILIPEITKRQQTPETRVGIFKLVTFTWIDRLIRNGRKNQLTSTDMYDLKPSEKGVILYARFNECWKAAQERIIKRKKFVSGQGLGAGSQSDDTTGELYSTSNASPILVERRKSLSRRLLARTLFDFGNPGFVFSAGYKLLYNLIGIVDPIFLKLIVSYLESDTLASKGRGVLFVVLMGLNQIGQTVILHQYFHIVMKLGVAIRSALSTAIYEKTLRYDANALKPEERDKYSSGKIINLMTTDTQRVSDFMVYIHVLWSSPMDLVIVSYLLYRELSWSAFCGIGIMVASIPLTTYMSQRMKKIQKTLMEIKDERIKLTTESFLGVKAVKLYAWEDAKIKEVTAIRERELKELWRVQINLLVQRVQLYSVPCLVAIVAFAFYVKVQKRDLDAATAFTSIALFNKLRFPLFALPNVVMSFAESAVTVKRLQDFFFLPELKPRKTIPSVAGEPNLIVNKLTVAFNEKEILKNLSFTANRGELVCIIGRTGSGKTTLLNALLGELKAVTTTQTTDGTNAAEKKKIELRGTVAYCSQNAWIQSGTVRDNILFGDVFDKDRYTKVVFACGLNDDMKVLVDGDQTEIGERGLNLSGGQKQRISLARAVYKKSDVYILDDVFSAVDAHVAEHIFEHAVKGILKDKTVVLVTHRLECLPYAKNIVFLRVEKEALTFKSVAEAKKESEYLDLAAETEKEMAELQTVSKAREAEQQLEHLLTPELGVPTRRSSSFIGGNAPEVYDQVDASVDSLRRRTSSSRFLSPEEDGDQDRLANTQEDARDFVFESRTPSPSGSKIPSAMRTSSKRSSSVRPSKALSFAVGDEKGRDLIGDENMEEGRVKGKVYLSYFGASGGWVMMAFILVILMIAQAASVGSNFWLSHWSGSISSSDPVGIDTGLGVFAGLQAAYIVATMFGSLFLAIAAQKASRSFHLEMITKTLRATMAFFESTPTGRLLNKFLKDLYTVDSAIPQTLYQFIQQALIVLAVLVTICVVLPIIIPVVAIALVVYLWVEKLYVSVARQIKRIDSVTKSPLYAHFQESVDGVKTIKAFKVAPQFKATHLRIQDENLAANYTYVSSNRWLAVRLETLGSILVVAVALGSVLSKGTISPAQSALAISYAISVTGSLNWLVRMSGDREANIVSVERVLELSDPELCPQEKYRDDDESRRTSSDTKDGKGGRRSPGGSLNTSIVNPEEDSLMPFTPEDEGSISFENVSLRYRDGLPFALKDVSFQIRPGQKVGVVGRTGAGKSSLTVCVLKLLEVTDGTIRLHGVAINPLSVTKLRRSLSMIPQDPVLFSGTIKSNLDPYGAATEEKLWEALRRACLEDFVRGLPDGLEHRIAESGSNLSSGQKQLLCLARILIKDTRLLLLDEATSAVDPQTDAQVQTAIRNEFKHCTVLTIAHRLKTVIDYDLIMVMGKGKILELAPPQVLLADPKSEFAQMYALLNN